MTTLALPRFAHAADCPRTSPTTARKIQGAQHRWCPSCGAQGVAIEAPEPPPDPMAGIVTRYTCRDHARPVTWRGTGCPVCIREREARVKARAELRAAR